MLKPLTDAELANLVLANERRLAQPEYVVSARDALALTRSFALNDRNGRPVVMPTYSSVNS